MSLERVVARYRIETALDVEAAAEAMAGEQSTGTFVAIPGETEALRQRFRARVEEVVLLDASDAPSLPGGRAPREGPSRYQRAEVTLSFPLENMGTNLPTLLATVAGNLTELQEHSGLRLLDLTLPESFRTAYLGPQFGIEGTRRLAGVYGRPIVGTIVKPSVGLTPHETADLVRELAEAGIDFVKDDELMANSPHSPLNERVDAVMDVIHRVADKTGKRVMYAVNITDEPEAMLRHHDHVARSGGTCVMVSLNSVGYGAVSHLRRHAALPIHGHRNGWGMYARHPYNGMEFAAYQKIWRLIGVDHLHVNGLQNKFWEPDESVVRSIRAVLTPLWEGDARAAMPVISSGQWGGQAPETYRQTGTVDVMYVAGGGIMAHPSGPPAGLAAIRQAWEAAVAGIPLETYAQTRPELRLSLEKFGGRRHG